MQARPEVVPQPEVEILAEIPAPIHVTHGFRSARPDSEAVSMPVDKPETVPTFVLLVRPEIQTQDHQKWHDLKEWTTFY